MGLWHWGLGITPLEHTVAVTEACGGAQAEEGVKADAQLALQCGLTPACLPALIAHNPTIANKAHNPSPNLAWGARCLACVARLHPAC